MGYTNDLNVKSLVLWPVATRRGQEGQSTHGSSVYVALVELHKLQLC